MRKYHTTNLKSNRQIPKDPIIVIKMPKASATKADTPTKVAAKELKAAKALKKQQKEDKPKIKRAPSPYIVFCTEKRTEAKDANPDATFGMLGKILGAMWGELDEAGKAPYVKVSAAKKAALESA